MAEQTVSVLNVVTRYISEIDEKSTKRTEKRVGGLNKLFKQAAGAFSAAVVVRGLADISAQAIQTAADFETVVQSFEVLTGSAEAAKKLIGEINEFSISTPFEPEQIQQSVKTLLGFGRANDIVIEDITLLGEVAAATGSDLQGLAVVFGQVAGAGRLMGQDALQFVNQGIPVYQLLSESMGLGTAELKKLQEQGKITFDDLRKAFEDAAGAGGRFSGALERQSQTLNGLRSTLRGIGTEILRNFGGRLLEPVKAVVRQFIVWGESVNKLVKVKVSKEIESQQIAFNSLLIRLKNVNTTEEERKDIIIELNENYKDYLKNIDLETASTEDLTKALNDANDAFVLKIALKLQEEKLETELRKQLDATFRASAAKLEITRLLSEASIKYGIAIDDTLTPLEQARKAQSDLSKQFTDARDSGGAIGKLYTELGVAITTFNEETFIAESAQDKYNKVLNDTNAAIKGLKKNYQGLLDPMEQFRLANEKAKEDAEKARVAILRADLQKQVDATQKQIVDAEIRKNSALGKVSARDKDRRIRIEKAFNLEILNLNKRLLKSQLELAKLDNVAKDINKIKTEIAEVTLEIKDLSEELRIIEIDLIPKFDREAAKEEAKELADFFLKAFQDVQQAIDPDIRIDPYTTSEIERLAGNVKDTVTEADDLRRAISELEGLDRVISLIFPDANLEQIGKISDEVRFLYSEIVRASSEADARRREALDNEVSLQQQRVNQILSLQEGASQEQLNIQQARLDEALRQQEQFAKKEQALAKATAAANIVAAIAKVAAETGVLSLGSIPLVLAGIAAAIAAVPALLLKDGTEYVTGKGTHTSDSIPARLSVGERVMSFKDNKAIQHIKNKDLTNYALVGEAASKGKLAPNVVSYMMDTSLGKKLDKLTKVMNKVDHSVRSIDIRASQNLDRDGLNQLVKLGIDRQNRQQARMR